MGQYYKAVVKQKNNLYQYEDYNTLKGEKHFICKKLMELAFFSNPLVEKISETLYFLTSKSGFQEITLKSGILKDDRVTYDRFDEVGKQLATV